MKTRRTPRHKILFESAIFDTLLGVVFIIAALTAGGYTSDAGAIVERVIGAPGWWGSAFLAVGILSMVGLKINSWVERLALSAVATVNASRAVGFLIISFLLLGMYDSPIVFTLGFAKAVVFARVAFGAFYHAVDVRYSEPLRDPDK